MVRRKVVPSSNGTATPAVPATCPQGLLEASRGQGGGVKVSSDLLGRGLEKGTERIP